LKSDVIWNTHTQKLKMFEKVERLFLASIRYRLLKHWFISKGKRCKNKTLRIIFAPKKEDVT